MNETRNMNVRGSKHHFSLQQTAASRLTEWHPASLSSLLTLGGVNEVWAAYYGDSLRHTLKRGITAVHLFAWLKCSFTFIHAIYIFNEKHWWNLNLFFYSPHEKSKGAVAPNPFGPGFRTKTSGVKTQPDHGLDQEAGTLVRRKRGGLDLDQTEL